MELLLRQWPKLITTARFFLPMISTDTLLKLSRSSRSSNRLKVCGLIPGCASLHTRYPY